MRLYKLKRIESHITGYCHYTTVGLVKSTRMSEADRDAAGRGALRTALLGAGGDLPHLELNASRTAARTDATGEPILMLEQNRALWDQIQIRRGMQALERARQLGGADGSYTLQAAIIACHSEAESAADTDWSRIAGLYAQLVVVVPTCCR